MPGYPRTIRVCVGCHEALGSILAALQLRTCPGCKQSLYPLEERTESVHIHRSNKPDGIHRPNSPQP